MRDYGGNQSASLEEAEREAGHRRNGKQAALCVEYILE
ncbi:MAG: hypothetical protein KatS3mg077_3364 [Candidatus Binatia bacterium]|nr:MAG: hypothetical protein KatS3mg077_3364 [Candidatus Binatia bacterium]